MGGSGGGAGGSLGGETGGLAGGLGGADGGMSGHRHVNIENAGVSAEQKNASVRTSPPVP